MRFYDREKEQQVLSEVLHRSKSEAKMTVLMGRRRIGKTELSLRCGDETVLYFGATDKPCGVRIVANPKQLLNGT